MPPTPPFQNLDVAAVFARFPERERAGLLNLRRRIFAVAAATQGVGPLYETLKWGDPAYLTQESKSGTSLRLGCPKSGGYALYVPCQTSIIEESRGRFGDLFRYGGTRAVLFEIGTDPPDAVDLILAHALTYKRRRKTGG